MAQTSTSSLWMTSFTVNHRSTGRRRLPIHSSRRRINQAKALASAVGIIKFGVLLLREGSNRRESIENVFKRELGVFGTGFAAGDHPLCFLKCCSVYQYDVLLFGGGSKKSRIIRTDILVRT